MELFRLFGSILIDDAEAIKTLKETDKRAKSTGEKFKDVAKKAAGIGTAVVGAGTVVAGGLTAIAKGTASAGDRVDKLSQKIGLSREGFQEWDFITSQSGMNIEQLQMGFKTLVNQVDGVTQGNKKSIENFEKLGISIKDAGGKIKSQEQIFEEAVTAFQGMEEGAEKAKLANDLFGRSGSELMPLLNGAAGSVEELKKQAHDMGMVMGDQAVTDAAALTDMLDVLQRTVGGLMNKLGAALMPVLMSVLQIITDNMPLIQGMFETLAPVLADVFEKLLPPLVELASALLPVIIDLFAEILPFLSEVMETIMPVIIDLLNMLLPPIIEIVKALLPVLISLIKPLLPLLQPILKLLQPFIDLLMILLEPLVDLINMILPPLISLFTQIMNKVLPPLTKAFEFLAGILGDVFKGALEGLKPIIDNVIGIFKGIIDFIKNVFTGNWKGAWESLVSIFSNIFSGIINIAKMPINFIIRAINGFLKGLNKIKIPDWIPGIGGKGLNIPLIPELKKGLDYVPYDEFPAILHKGERVLTAEENKAYSNGSGGGSGVNIVVENMVVRDDRDIEKIAQEFYRLQQRKLRAQGAY